jgi:hypothetical protein
MVALLASFMLSSTNVQKFNILMLVTIIILFQIEKVSNVAELKEIIDKCDFRFECGFLKPTNSITMEDKETFVKVTKRHFVLNRCQSEMEQFLLGK